MIQLFDPENKFWQFLSKVTDAACMSLLWLLTSIPLVTIGASTAAFYDFTLNQVQDLEGSLCKSYFTAFKAHFKRATLLWLLQLAGTVFFAADMLAAWNYYLVNGGAMGILLLGVCGFGALTFLSCCFYGLPLLAYDDFTWRELFSGCFLMAVGSLHVTVTLAVLALLICVLIFYLSGLFFFWIGLFIFLSSYLIYGVIVKYAAAASGVKAEMDSRRGDREALPDEKEQWLI